MVVLFCRRVWEEKCDPCSRLLTIIPTLLCFRSTMNLWNRKSNDWDWSRSHPLLTSRKLSNWNKFLRNFMELQAKSGNGYKFSMLRQFQTIWEYHHHHLNVPFPRLIMAGWTAASQKFSNIVFHLCCLCWWPDGLGQNYSGFNGKSPKAGKESRVTTTTIERQKAQAAKLQSELDTVIFNFFSSHYFLHTRKSPNNFTEFIIMSVFMSDIYLFLSVL